MERKVYSPPDSGMRRASAPSAASPAEPAEKDGESEGPNGKPREGDKDRAAGRPAVGDGSAELIPHGEPDRAVSEGGALRRTP